jgi:hypothetical protein
MPTCRSILCIAALFSGSSLAWADNIVLNNSAFSALDPGGYSYTVPGWSGTGFYGEYNPVLGPGTFNSLPGGPSVGFTTGVLSQSVGPVQANNTYTLSVDIGQTNYLSAIGSIDLMVNGVAYRGVGTSPTPGGWSIYTVTYSALQKDVGSQIYIQLMNGNFADVQLNVNDPPDAAPEPSTFALLLAGAGAVYLGARRRGLNTSFTFEA